MHVPGGGGGDSGFFDEFTSKISRAVVSTWINSGGTAQQASFSVDLEQIPGLIAKYEEARDKLRNILNKAQQLEQVGRSGAPGNDEVSKQLAQALGRTAGKEPGCLSWAVNDGIDRLNSQIEQLETAKRNYEASDDTANPRIT